MRLTDLSLMFSSAACNLASAAMRLCRPFLGANQFFNTVNVRRRTDRFWSTTTGLAFGRISSSSNAATNFCTILNFHSLYGYARIIAFASHPCSRSVCIRTLSACDTFPSLTALTKCWLLTVILPKYRVLYLHIRLPDEFASLQRHR